MKLQIFNHIKKTALIAPALIALGTMVACESDFSPESMVGDTWSKILSIKNSGEQSLVLLGNEDVKSFTLQVLKGGRNTTHSPRRLPWKAAAPVCSMRLW